jgi:hypothetical protein
LLQRIADSILVSENETKEKRSKRKEICRNGKGGINFKKRG